MFPEASEKKIQKMTNICSAYADQEGVEFSLGGLDLSNTEVFSDAGLLTIFLAEAKDVYEKLYNNLFTANELTEAIGKKTKELSTENNLLEFNFLNGKKKEKVFPIIFIEKEEDTYLGIIPKLNEEIPADFFTMAHFLHYTVEEYLKIYKKNKLLLVNGKVPLDALVDKFMEKIDKNIIVPKPSLGIKLENQDSLQN